MCDVQVWQTVKQTCKALKVCVIFYRKTIVRSLCLIKGKSGNSIHKRLKLKALKTYWIGIYDAVFTWKIYVGT